MEQFLELIVAFPTVIFTVLMGAVLGFWGIAILGAIDIEILDFDADMDALDSLGGDVDFDVDADVDADVDGDIDAAHGTDLGHHGGGVGGLLSTWGLTGVPVTVAISLVILLGWVGCMIFAKPAMALAGDGVLGALAGIGVGLGSLALGIPLAAQAIKPLKRFYVTHQAVSRRSLIGKSCVIATGRVTADFGQAEIEDGGAGLLVQVRCPRENSLGKLSKAIVFDYDARREVFLVTEDTGATLPNDMAD